MANGSERTVSLGAESGLSPNVVKRFPPQRTETTATDPALNLTSHVPTHTEYGEGTEDPSSMIFGRYWNTGFMAR